MRSDTARLQRDLLGTRQADRLVFLDDASGGFAGAGHHEFTQGPTRKRRRLPQQRLLIYGHARLHRAGLALLRARVLHEN
jgi:hypothetical protein